MKQPLAVLRLAIENLKFNIFEQGLSSVYEEDRIKTILDLQQDQKDCEKAIELIEKYCSQYTDSNYCQCEKGNFVISMKTGNYHCSNCHKDIKLQGDTKTGTSIDYKAKYGKCIDVIKRFDAGIIGMYDL